MSIGGMVAVGVLVAVALAVAVAVLVDVALAVAVAVLVAVLVLVLVDVAVAVGTDERQRMVRSAPDAALSDTENWAAQWIVHCAPGRIVIDRVAAITNGVAIKRIEMTKSEINRCLLRTSPFALSEDNVGPN